ncbi:MAG: SDR family NAD(P)-dependent oxidoreductase, partial [Acidimicrobiales bacterium]|nr:SDR family NAD(P)-dependent oxidoreductase [Acidimicrobiales bacterium]
MLPEGTFKGRSALVTGGGTGIGLGIASELCRLGADVALASRREEHYEHAAAELAGAGRSAIGVKLDIRD